jgi:hypothetical protein
MSTRRGKRLIGERVTGENGKEEKLTEENNWGKG